MPARKPQRKATARNPKQRKNPVQAKKIKQLRGKVQDFRAEFGTLGSSQADTEDVTPDYIGQGFSTTSNVRAQGKAYALGQEGFGGSFLGESSTRGSAKDLGFGGEGLGSTVGKKNVKKKSTQRKIAQAKKAGNFQKAQKIRARARKR